MTDSSDRSLEAVASRLERKVASASL